MKTFLHRQRGGYIMIINTLLFISILTVIIVGLANVVLSHYGSAQGFVYSKKAYLAGHSAVEEALYRLKTGKNLASNESISLASGNANIVTSISGSGKKVVVTANSNGYVRIIEVDVSLGTGISFHYGIQSGQGGFVLQNSSSVTGNVFSGGTVTGTGVSNTCGTVSGNGNCIFGDVISAGSAGAIYGIHATGTVYAHTVGTAGTPTTVDKNAYFQSITNTSVAGTQYPNSTDQPIVPLPISDAQISQWESDASAGNTYSCTSGSYTISADTTIGPAVIPCDLNIKGTAGGITVTVNGPIWVKGNISTTNKSTIQMSPSLGSSNVAVIADDPNNPLTKGIIGISQSVSFAGSGAVGSYVFMISQNKSAENGGTTDALTMDNGASALVAYAAHGQITLSQSTSVKEVTAYRIVLINSANVVYDAGLPSVLFEAGPGGSYDIIDWVEI